MTEEAWSAIALLPRSEGRRGGQWRDHQMIINGILWKLRPSGRGRPRTRSDHLIDDKGYSYPCCRRLLRKRQIPHNIPERCDQRARRVTLRAPAWNYHTQSRELARLHAGRDPTPSAAIIDSQSAKTLSGGVRRSDGGKKNAGRKRHILVDTLGFLLAVVVHSANISDRQGGKLLLDTLGSAFPRLQRIRADQGYTGGFILWAAQQHGIALEVVYPP